MNLPTVRDSQHLVCRIQAAVMLLVFLWTGTGPAATPDPLPQAHARPETAPPDTIRATGNWPLPPDGPPGLPDKTLVFIGEDFRNAGILGVGAGVKEATTAMGWQVRFLDIGTNDDHRREIFQKAFDLRPDALILGGMDAVGNLKFLTPFKAAKIPMVGWHVAPGPGPVENTPVRVNIATDSIEVAKAAANYVIARAKGNAGVVIFTDSRFAIAVQKSQTMAELIRQSPDCRLLEVVDIPLDRAGAVMPGVTERLLWEYGKNWQYSLAINDLYFDHAIATLVMNGCPPQGPPANISAGDGSPSALIRIRNKSYQAATIPEPLLFQGWQLVDELNRALQGRGPGNYRIPPAVLTSDTIRPPRGDVDLFDPENGYRKAYKRIWKRN